MFDMKEILAPIPPITQEELTEECKEVKEHDLYKALHHVGDDPTKSFINRQLKAHLDEASYQKVVAIFNLSTEWKSDE